jgi:branched-chain amino acid transport system ATP-binding protein
MWRRAADHKRDEALALLDQVGMKSQADRPCSVLAYGDVKRVELAIAMANAPKLLLMDEPTAGMAPKERNSLMALTKDLVIQRGMAVLFTEHSMDVVFAYADRMIVLARGRLIAQGKPLEIRDHPKVQEVYFGSGKTFEEDRREGCGRVAALGQRHERHEPCWRPRPCAPGMAPRRSFTTSTSTCGAAKWSRSWAATARASRPR